MKNHSTIISDLKYNVLDTADHFLQLDNIEKHYYRKTKLKIYLASTFYELFFKLKLNHIDLN